MIYKSYFNKGIKNRWESYKKKSRDSAINLGLHLSNIKKLDN